MQRITKDFIICEDGGGDGPKSYLELATSINTVIFYFCFVFLHGSLNRNYLFGDDQG